MKKLILILIITMPVLLLGQSYDCSRVIKKEDEFRGVTYYLSNMSFDSTIILKQWKYSVLGFDTSLVSVSFSFLGLAKWVISTDDTFFIKLEDGTILKQNPKKSNLGGDIVHNSWRWYTFNFSMKSKEYKLLLNQKIAKVQWHGMVPDILPAQAQMLQDDLNCLIKKVVENKK